MPENTVNPYLRLSDEHGNGEFQRKQQVTLVEPFDWRDWVNHIEYETIEEPAIIALAVDRFTDVLNAANIDAALIEFKRTVLKVKVSHEYPPA